MGDLRFWTVPFADISSFSNGAGTGVGIDKLTLGVTLASKEHTCESRREKPVLQLAVSVFPA